jgi:hypothetical protein
LTCLKRGATMATLTVVAQGGDDGFGGSRRWAAGGKPAVELVGVNSTAPFRVNST